MFTPLFHVQLKKKRLKAGLSQKEAARICGLSAGRWSQLETGYRLPGPQELYQIDRTLSLRVYFLPPSRVNQKLRCLGHRALPVAKPYFQPSDRLANIRYRSALKRHGPRVRGLESLLRRREDFEVVQYFCHYLPMDSGLEALYVLCLLTSGGAPLWIAPLHLGHLPHPIIDPISYSEVGHRPHLALACGDTFYFFQTCFLCPDAIKVDVLVREPNGWGVIEINGPGHDPTNDLQRVEAIGLKTRCLTESDVVRWARGLLEQGWVA